MTDDTAVEGLRKHIRCALYHGHKYDLGCPKTGLCTLFKILGTEKPCSPDNGCHSFVGPVEEQPDQMAVKRLRFLLRIQSMVNVGCTFGPNDLDPRTWSELIMLALEQQRMQDLLREGRDRKNAEKRPALSAPEEQAALRTNRKELGVPEGGRLFPATQPMR